MGIRRKFTKDFKRKIVNELDGRPVEEISREYELHPQLVFRWKREFESNPQDSFSGNGNLWKEDSRIAQLERKVGQQAMVIDWLKKISPTRPSSERKRKERGGLSNDSKFAFRRY